MEIIFLGTSGGMPTETRNLPSIVLRREGKLFMFDCGEGTQKQMMRTKIGFNRGMNVFISHMHGDHVLGLPGMIQSMALLRREKPLSIYGPKGIIGFLEAINTHVPYVPSFETKIYEIQEGIILDDPEYFIQATQVDHSDLSYAFAFTEKPRPGKFNPKAALKLNIPEGPLWKDLQLGNPITLDGRVINPRKVVGPPRPGRKVVYSGDTRPCPSILRLARSADALIFESTFDESKSNKAKEYRHSTSTQAAKIAKKARAKRLYLTHLSAIYDDQDRTPLKQARKIFRQTILATDLLKIKV